MEITGIIKAIGETTQVSEKFRKREFVLTDASTQYPQHISFQLNQDKCELINGYHIGSEIKVHFNLNGREWTNPQGKVICFNTLVAWKLEGQQTEVINTDNVNNKSVVDPDDLPF